MNDAESLTEDEIAAAAAHDADEWQRLARGEIALTPEHFYFFFGDIFDVYYVRLPARAGLAFELVKCNPVEDTDDALTSRPALLGVASDGRLMLLAADEPHPTGYTVRDLAPFGYRQAQWYREGLERGDDTMQRLLS